MANGKRPAKETVDSGRPGRVITAYGNAVIVEDERGQSVECSVRKRAGRVICGDRVRWQSTSPTQGVVESIEPRATLLERHDGRGRGKPMAANVDQIVIVLAVKPALSEELIDRYLVAAGLVGAGTCLVINKQDMVSPHRRTELEQRLSCYPAAGYGLLWVDTVTDGGLNDLLQHLQGKTSILVGQSGVGKSSIIARLLPERTVRVGALSEASSQGCHTTTETTLYHISRHSDLIDSPGVRDFQLWHIKPEQVIAGYPELQALAGDCRFHNCQHLNEPGCAVQAAAREGKIDAGRLQRYQKIIDTLQARVGKPVYPQH